MDDEIKKEVEIQVKEIINKDSVAFKEAVQKILKETYGDDLISTKEFLVKNV